MPLFVLTGRARSGKDTVGNLIEEWIRRNFPSQLGINKFALADPLKEMCCELFEKDPYSLEFIKGFNPTLQTNYENDIYRASQGRVNPFFCTMRQFMINLARMIKKEHGEMYFVSKAINKIKNQPDVIDIITDLRYRKEYETFRSFASPDTVIIKITRQSVEKLDDEDDIDSFTVDYTIENNSSLDDLKTWVENLMSNHFSTLYSKK